MPLWTGQLVTAFCPLMFQLFLVSFVSWVSYSKMLGSDPFPRCAGALCKSEVLYEMWL